MESIGAVGSVIFGMGQQRQDALHFNERARPSVCQDERQRARVATTLMQEVNVGAVYARHLLVKSIQP